MKNPIKAPFKLARVLLLGSPALLLGGCLQPAPGGVVVGVTADQAMARANQAYDLAARAEADAQAARTASATMYQRSMYK